MIMTTWRKSGHSGSQNTCVELADTLDRIRDSKNPNGSILRADIGRLLDAVRADRFSR
jgi:hypothetical protein